MTSHQTSAASAPHISTAFDGVRLHVVTGKGGTGKSTFAAALALSLAEAGKKVLLCEVEGRQSLSRLFGVAGVSYTEERVAVSRQGGEVYALSVEPRAALMDYLDTFYVMGGRAGKMLDKIGAVEFATTIAPGLRDVLLTGKVYEAAGRTTKGRRRHGGDPVFDAVVVDAPPTGRVTRFLNVSAEVSGLAKIGPIHKQADSMRQMMHSDSTRVHLVTLLEEMPVQETQDGIDELRAAALPVGAVVMNQIRKSDFSSAEHAALARGEVEVDDLAEVLHGTVAGECPDPDTVAEGLLRFGRDHADRLAMQADQMDRVLDFGQPTLRLPQLMGNVDLGGLHDLADVIRKQGVRS